MKQRNGFVSNSSSSSFIVKKMDISYSEGEMLLGYENNDSESWLIYEEGDSIVGYTYMDNDGLWEYLQAAGFPTDKIEVRNF